MSVQGVAADMPWQTATGGTTKLVGVPICPDLLDIDDLGAADGPRGERVRAFFQALRDEQASSEEKRADE